MDIIKTLSVDLIEDLNKAYPMPSCDDLLKMGDRELRDTLARRSVVEFLNIRLEQSRGEDFVQ